MAVMMIEDDYAPQRCKNVHDWRSSGGGRRRSFSATPCLAVLRSKSRLISTVRRVEGNHWRSVQKSHISTQMASAALTMCVLSLNDEQTPLISIRGWT